MEEKIIKIKKGEKITRELVEAKLGAIAPEEFGAPDSEHEEATVFVFEEEE